MSYAATFDAKEQLAVLNQLIMTALGQDVDVINDTGSGFVAVMGKKNPHIQQDVPAAYEMYTLLMHYLTTLPLFVGPLGAVDTILAPAIHFDVEAGRVLALVPIGEQEMELVAHWLADGLRSSTVKAMAGLIAMPFSIEEHDGVKHLIPEWFAAFYVGGNEDHCVPMLSLRSVTLDERFGDWVAVALERMKIFGMPSDSAQNAMSQKTAQ